MTGWHHQLKGNESEQTLRDSERQGSLACCNPWGHRVGHDLATEQQKQREGIKSRLSLKLTGGLNKM